MGVQANQLVPAKSASYAATITPSTAASIAALEGQIVEINAGDEAVYLSYSDTASATVFDAYCAAGATRHFVMPVDQTTVSIYSAGSVVVLVY